jgi:hypothetical protein
MVRNLSEPSPTDASIDLAAPLARSVPFHLFSIGALSRRATFLPRLFPMAAG